jgi:hypothetical protein
VFVEASPDNAGRLLEALSEFFGGVDLGYAVDDVVDPKWVLQLGVPPVRIDLIRAKEAADRPQDRADLVVLRKAKQRGSAGH